MLQTAKFIWGHPVSSVNRFAAFSRYLRWQVGTRLLAAPVLIPFAGAAHLVCARSMTGATGNFYCGLHEFGDMGFLLHVLRRDELFVDVGANVGTFSVLASSLVGARSIAIEPVPTTFESLRLNIAVNHLETLVEPHRVAVGATVGRIQFSVDRDTVNSVVDETYSGKSAEVPVVPLDVLADGKQPTLIKVDVEGFESQVLAGAVRTLQSRSVLAVLLESNSQSISRTMEDVGFSHVTYSPMTRRVELAGSTARRSQGDTVNHLWVRDIEAVAERCKASKSYSVYGVTF